MDEAKPNRRKRSPTEDKRLSYERDGRNTYGESTGASRKAIHRFKAQSGRAARHGAKSILGAASATFDERAERALLRAELKGLQPSKTKGADEPLGIVIAKKKAARVARAGRKQRTKA